MTAAGRAVPIRKSMIAIVFMLSQNAFAQAAEPIYAMSPPPPAPVVTVREPPRVAEFAQRDQERRQVMTFDLEVRGGKELIWAGSLRVAASAAGDYSQSRREPFDSCPGEPGASNYPGRQNELRLSLSRNYGNDAPNRFNLAVNWVRPVEDCAEGHGNRAAAIQQTFNLMPGESRQFSGDGGLAVKLTRRR